MSNEYPDDLPFVCVAQIAMAAGTTAQQVTTWIGRYGDDDDPDKPPFPAPMYTFPAGRTQTFSIYWWPDVKQWLMDTNRRYNATHTTLETVYKYKQEFPEEVIRARRARRAKKSA